MDTDVPRSKPGHIPELSDSRFKKPERQRGRWNFLTWSFFLSQVMATDVFFGRGAQAGQDEYDDVAQPSSDPGSAFDSGPSAASAIAATAEDILQDDALPLRHDGGAASSMLLLQNVHGGNGFKSSANNAQAGASGGGGGSSGSRSFKSDGEAPKSVKSEGEGLNPLDARDGALDAAVDATSKLSPDPVASSPDEGGGTAPDLNRDVGSGPPHFDGIKPPSVIANDPTAELTPTGGIADPNHLLGLELHVGPDGVLLGADLSLAPIPNPAHVVSDLVQALGVTTSVNLSDILGFDFYLTAEGTLVAADLSLLSNFSADQLVSDLIHTSGLSTEVNLSHILGFDAQFDVASLLQAAPQELPASDAGGSLPQCITSTLAEVTGLQLFDHSGSLTAALANTPGLDPIATLTKPVDTSVGSQEGEPGAHVLSELTDLGTLKQSGDVSSGGSIDFSAQKLAQLDELFNGNGYTDYHVTLQSNNSDLGKITGTLKSAAVDHAEASLANDTSTDSQDDANAIATTTKLAALATETSVVNTSVSIPASTSLEELSGHALSI